MMEEVWKDIEGYEGIYQVSNLGRIKRLAYSVEITMPDGRVYIRKQKEIIIRPFPDSQGRYILVSLHTGKPKRNFLVHRLVAKAFIPNPDNLPEVNHINENKHDNKVENLEYCGRIYNAKYGNNSRYRKVEQIDKFGNVIATYDGIREAGAATGIKHESISACCRGRKGYPRAGGYRWRYADQPKH